MLRINCFEVMPQSIDTEYRASEPNCVNRFRMVAESRSVNEQKIIYTNVIEKIITINSDGIDLGTS